MGNTSMSQTSFFTPLLDLPAFKELKSASCRDRKISLTFYGLVTFILISLFLIRWVRT